MAAYYGLVLENEDIIPEAKREKVLMGVWTVNDISLMKSMIDMRVEFIITDEPLLAKEYLDSFKDEIE
jgi:glycerophosphoryl diester phosphodiesterase